MTNIEVLLMVLVALGVLTIVLIGSLAWSFYRQIALLVRPLTKHDAGTLVVTIKADTSQVTAELAKVNADLAKVSAAYKDFVVTVGALR